MENIPKTIEQILEVLAQKFGQTGEVLWKSIIAQQKIDAGFSLVWSVSALILGIIFGNYLFINLLVYWWLGWLPLLIGIIVCIAELRDSITAFCNPTYSALEDILGKINPGEQTNQ